MSETSPWAQWVPPLVTVLGWGIVNYQTNRREARKEDRALIDAAKKLVVETGAAARRYMADAHRNPDTETDIKLALQQLEIELNRLPGYTANVALVEAMAAFGDASTGGDFESANRRSKTSADPAMQALASSRNELLAQLELEFVLRHSSWARRWKARRDQKRLLKP